MTGGVRSDRTDPARPDRRQHIVATGSRPAGDGSAQPQESRPAVEAVDITKSYGPTKALDGVDIAVAHGDSHALVGRNGAGKSTLVSIITGLQAPDSGSVSFAGRPAPALADRDAWRRMVACVYQKSTIIPGLSVAENLFLNRQERGFARMISWSAMRRRASALLADWDIGIDVDRPAADLGVEQRQMLEIARALSFGARLIILDEPTAQLDSAGIERLFVRIRDLQTHGVTLLFISHHLEEIYEICQTVTVFRDARKILTAPVAQLGQRDLVSAMTGETGTTGRRAARAGPASEGAGPAGDRPVPAALTVRGISSPGFFDDISLDVRAAEVVGIAGSGSSGRVALAETIVGLRSHRGGTVEVNGRRVRPGSVPAALAAGIGFVPRDRHKEGYVPALSVAENATMTITPRLSRFGLVNLARRDKLAARLMTDLAIVASGPEQEVASLSGGNQQKVVMARALAGDPTLLVLMHPTAGVDVRSKQTLLDVVEDVRLTGTGVLIVSDELEDLRPCDRVLVMFHGRVVDEFNRGWESAALIASIEGIGSDHD